MTIEQTVEIPQSHRLFVVVPPEIPAGKAKLTFTALSEKEDLEYAQEIFTNNRAHTAELRDKLANLRGCLGNDAFNALDGVAYQSMVRSEWDD